MTYKIYVQGGHLKPQYWVGANVAEAFFKFADCFGLSSVKEYVLDGETISARMDSGDGKIWDVLVSPKEPILVDNKR